MVRPATIPRRRPPCRHQAVLRCPRVLLVREPRAGLQTLPPATGHHDEGHGEVKRMGYQIVQIKDANGNYVDWDGRLVALSDGTLGSIVVKRVLEDHVTRDKGLDVNLPANAD